MSDIDKKSNDGITKNVIAMSCIWLLAINSRVFNARLMKINQTSKRLVFKNKYLNIGNERYTKLTRILKICINGLLISVAPTIVLMGGVVPAFLNLLLRRMCCSNSILFFKLYFFILLVTTYKILARRVSRRRIYKGKHKVTYVRSN